MFLLRTGGARQVGALCQLRENAYLTWSRLALELAGKVAAPPCITAPVPEICQSMFPDIELDQRLVGRNHARIQQQHALFSFELELTSNIHTQFSFCHKHPTQTPMMSISRASSQRYLP